MRQVEFQHDLFFIHGIQPDGNRFQKMDGGVGLRIRKFDPKGVDPPFFTKRGTLHQGLGGVRLGTDQSACPQFDSAEITDDNGDDIGQVLFLENFHDRHPGGS